MASRALAGRARPFSASLVFGVGVRHEFDKAGAEAQIRIIYYYYHSVTQGWQDIGYEFLIDKFGNVYEGGRRVVTASTCRGPPCSSTR